MERGVGERVIVEVTSTKVTRPQVFDKISLQVLGFVMVCRLYIRMKMRGAVVEKQIQWILSYVQGRLVDVWKENTLEDLEVGLLEYETIEEFLADIRKKFVRGDKESVKVAELKRLEQEGKTIKEFIQKFRRAVRGSGYKRRPLVEEFKREIHTMV